MSNLFNPPLYIKGEKFNYGATVSEMFGFFYREANNQGWSKTQKETVLDECYRFGYSHTLSTINAHISATDKEVTP